MRRLIIVVAGLAVLAAACAQPGDPVAASNESPDGDWTLVSGVPIVDGGPITLSIDGDDLGGRAACNTYGGTATISGDTIAIPADGPGGTFFMTEMGCEPSIQASESAFIDALFAVTNWVVTGDRLELTSATATLVFERLAPVPTADIVGTVWVLESLVEGDGVMSVAGDEATLVLSDDGTLSGGTGCRSLNGTWVERNGEIYFPNFAAEGECAPELAPQDGQIVGVLGDGFTAEVEGDQLLVTDVSGDALMYKSR